MAEWECVPHAYPSNIAETLAALWNPTMRMCHPTGNRHNGMQLVLFIPEPICTFLQTDTSLETGSHVDHHSVLGALTLIRTQNGRYLYFHNFYSCVNVIICENSAYKDWEAISA